MLKCGEPAPSAGFIFTKKPDSKFADHEFGHLIDALKYGILC